MSTSKALQPLSHLEGSLDVYDPDARLAGVFRPVIGLTAALVLGVGLAGALIPIGGAVIGSGQFGVESHVKKITHPLGGTIAAILVQNGQHVRKGQVLIRLDDKVTGADATFATLSLDQMLAQKARLEAEQMNASSISFPAALTSRSDSAATKAMADEQHMFAIRRSEAAGITAQLNARIGQFEEQISGYRAQIAALNQQKTLIEPERKGVAELYAKKLVTLSRLNQLERTAVDMTGSIGSLTAQIAAAQAQISETREQIIQTQQSRRSEAGAQLAQINTQLNQQQARSVTAMDAQDRSVIRAPYDGIVDKMTVTTVGGVIRPAEEIMTLVPDQDRLMVDGAISPADIDKIHSGQAARVRLSTVGGGATPEVSGKLVYVGADRVTDANGANSYFPVRVALDPQALSQEHVTVKSGMPAEIFVETGSRSMLSYITRPLRDQIARAFRDN